MHFIGAFTDEETAISYGGMWAGIEVGDGSGEFVTRNILGVSNEHGLGVATTPGACDHETMTF